jgi:hypothetical protein
MAENQQPEQHNKEESHGAERYQDRQLELKPHRLKSIPAFANMAAEKEYEC